ncbi:MAG: hypothetical protein GPJ54_11535 [Candidatus Heimdallarchaeota archaeon]|nr:hypothetical protein [Candidatus Heimdallarchaeota archaeon]
MDQIAFLVVSLLYLIPLFVAIRLYLLVKYIDYLLAAVVFLLISVDAILLSLNQAIALYENIIALVTFSIVYTFCYHMMRDKIKVSRKMWYVTVFSLSIYVLPVAFFQDEIDLRFTLFRYILFEIMRLMIGFVVVHSFLEVTEIKKTKRTRLAKRSWALGGLVLMIIAIVRIALTLYSLFQLFVLDHDISIDDYSVKLGYNIIIIGAIFLSLVVVFNVVILPEGLMLSYSQILRSSKLYDMLENLPLEINQDISTSQLKSYLQEIAPVLKTKKT